MTLVLIVNCCCPCFCDFLRKACQYIVINNNWHVVFCLIWRFSSVAQVWIANHSDKNFEGQDQTVHRQVRWYILLSSKNFKTDENSQNWSWFERCYRWWIETFQMHERCSRWSCHSAWLHNNDQRTGSYTRWTMDDIEAGQNWIIWCRGWLGVSWSRSMLIILMLRFRPVDVLQVLHGRMP